MTAHPIDTEALRGRALGQLGKPQVDPRWPGLVLALIDLIADTKARAEAAEHRATRAEAQSAIRKKQVAYWRAETQKVRDRLRALDGVA